LYVINIFFAIILEHKQQIRNNSLESTLDSEEKEEENIKLQINKSTNLIIDDSICFVIYKCYVYVVM